MKKIKVLLAGLLVSFMAAASAFAYDGTVVVCRELATTDYDTFIEAFDDDCEETTAEFLENNYGSDYNKLFLIDSSKIDEEDNELLGDLETYLEDKQEATVNTIYQTLVVRNNTDDFIDGWVVYSQYDKKNGWSHYMVYFAY